MDNKKFFSELQKQSGIEKALLNRMLDVTLNILREQGVNLKPVNIDGLGVFESKKRKECLFVNKENGEEILYPPKVVVRFVADRSYVEGLKCINN